MRKILLITDGEDGGGALGATDPVTPALSAEGYLVARITPPAAVRQPWTDPAPDLVLVELARPRPGGAGWCGRIREHSQVPLIVLAAWDDEDDRVGALTAGADDYLIRPFSLRELVARIGAVLRRSDHVPELLPVIMEAGDVRVDLSRHQLSVRGERVSIPLMLFTLLSVLMRDQGRVISREELADRIGSAEAEASPQAVTTHIRRLRAAIETDPASPRHVKTVRGRGYIFDP